MIPPIVAIFKVFRYGIVSLVISSCPSVQLIFRPPRKNYHFVPKFFGQIKQFRHPLFFFTAKKVAVKVNMQTAITILVRGVAVSTKKIKRNFVLVGNLLVISKGCGMGNVFKAVVKRAVLFVFYKISTKIGLYNSCIIVFVPILVLIL